ncbi:MAG: EAL domain-containing protein [Alphaproteobacteria bacterium]|nr:EAL domain-containing protein [Alphaproteobacteria bacterium]NCQ67217.1 EAL domain-containing protein [Alphaproteobacteria bacterium]NCT07061.1 EAL domain-containing protein [Alphaproteobacteria bacterium]
MQKILLVDDRQVNIDRLSRHLSKFFKCELEVFFSPLQALEWSGHNEFDLALIEYRMTELSGIELVRAIRRQKCHQSVPLVLVTSESDKAIVSDAFDAGISDYLMSPYGHSELIARVQNLLTLRKATLKLQAEKRDLNELVQKATIDLQESEQRFRLALEGTRDGIWDWDLRTGEIFYSSNWCKMLGYDKEEIPTLPAFWMARVHPDDSYVLASAIDNHVMGKSDVIDCEYRIKHRKKYDIWVHTKGKAVRDSHGTAIRIVGAQCDISDLKEIQNKLTHNALHDTLTGLPNRSLFNERLNQAFLRFKRNKQDRFAVLFVDLDHFKDINDTYGHGAGDKILVEVTNVLKRCTREVDTVARIGGDEFVILLEETGTEAEAQVYIDRLYEEAKFPVSIVGSNIQVSLSIGSAFVHHSHTTHESVLKEADVALYQAKEKGRGCSVFYRRDMGEISPRLREIKASLGSALSNAEIMIYYQPIVCLKTQEHLGYEALLRWHHPTMGIIDPEDFIPVAEKDHTIVRLGTFVMEGAVAQLAKWQKKYKKPDLFMCINVTSAQVFQEGYFDLLQKTCAGVNIVPDKIVLEFSEISLAEIYKWNSSIFAEMKKEGFHIALDDYGEGRASIRSLVDYQMDFLKIDRSLSLEALSDERKRRLFELMIHLGLESQFQIVVEGIQTPEILKYVIGSKAQMGQGYLFSRPCPPQQIEALLKKQA